MPWSADPVHSHIAFGVKHLGLSLVRGEFKTFTVESEIDESDITRSKASVTVDVASIQSSMEVIGQHLKGADFLDAENHSTITFTTKRLTRDSVVGDLTIRGNTKEVQLAAEMAGPIQDPWGKTRAGLTATGKIDRRDFGITKDFGPVVSETVHLTIDLELIKL